jgi:hypothetical protein
MSGSTEYRCVTCLDETVAREFDVSHVSRTCGVCEEFERFVNTVVIERFNELDADPPPHLHWEQLDRPRKFLIAERLSRKDHSVDDFTVTVDDESENAGTTEPNAEV